MPGATAISTRIPGLDDGIRRLAEQGLNLFAVLDCGALPASVYESMSGSIDMSRYSSLVVLGNTGTQFWHALEGAGVPRTDPMDTFSKRVTREFLDNTLAGEVSDIVFPSHHMIPLQRIGALLGWGEVSPLGVGISERLGLWFAYRSAFLTTAELPASKKIQQSYPCADCPDTPCVSACPAAAVSTEKSFNVDACFHFRATDNSPCRSRCLAREACPIGVDSRYPRDMISYIYETSMDTVLHYCNSS